MSCVGCVENQPNQLAHTCMSQIYSSQESTSSFASIKDGDTKQSTTSNTLCLSPSRKTFMETLLEEYEVAHLHLSTSMKKIQVLIAAYRKIDVSSLCEHRIVAISHLNDTVLVHMDEHSPNKKSLHDLFKAFFEQKHLLLVYTMAQERLRLHQNARIKTHQPLL